MSLAAARRALLAALEAGRYEHEARDTLAEKNLLAVGDVDAAFVALLLRRTRGNQYEEVPRLDMEILKEGDHGTALAPGRGRVPVTYRYRTVTLDSGVRVDDVLVGVDHEGEVLTIPAQSTPKIREARHQVKEETVSVRIPRELDDILWLASDALEASPSRFAPAVVRFYLHEALHDDRLAQRLYTLSRHRIARARASKKLTLRADADLLESVGALSDRHGSTRSDLVRGAVLAMKEDVFDGRAPRRRQRLQAVARAL